MHGVQPGQSGIGRLESGDIARRKGLGGAFQKDTERGVRPIIQQHTNFVTDDRLRQELGDVAALLQLPAGETDSSGTTPGFSVLDQWAWKGSNGW